MVMSARRLGPARALKVWLDVVLVLGGLGGAVVAVWLAVSPFVLRAGGRPVDAQVRVSLGPSMLLPVSAVVATAADDAIRSTHLVKARGELRFETTDWLVQVVSNGAQLLTLVFALAGIYLAREMLRAAIAGAPFAPANVRRLRRLALLLVAAGLVVPLVEYAAARMVLARLLVEGTPLSPSPPIALDPILAGLLVLVLAAVFQHGATLEDDRSLTV